MLIGTALLQRKNRHMSSRPVRSLFEVLEISTKFLPTTTLKVSNHRGRSPGLQGFVGNVVPTRYEFDLVRNSGPAAERPTTSPPEGQENGTSLTNNPINENRRGLGYESGL
jgi:hypothetical protein